MNKDAILATVIGFMIGALITSAILFGPALTKSLPKISLPKLPTFIAKKQDENTVLSNTIKNESEEKKDPGQGITEPEDSAIVKDENLTVKGSAIPNGLVVLVSPIDEVTVAADGNGQYSAEILLKEGYNKITALYKDQGKTVSTSREIFFTEEEL